MTDPAQLAFAAGVEASAAYVEEATNAGCLVIDLSGLFALEPDVPLVVPDVNPFVLGDYRNRNLIAVPNNPDQSAVDGAQTADRSGRVVAH